MIALDLLKNKKMTKTASVEDSDKILSKFGSLKYPNTLSINSQP